MRERKNAYKGEEWNKAMSRIAILDTGVEPARLHCKSFQSYNIYGDEARCSAAYSHGTACASVLDWFASGYELVSIQVMAQTCDEEHGKPMGMIEHLRKGLLLCVTLGVDIVCMSAVSSVLSDSAYLYDAAKKLSEQSIIVAALDNRGFLTIPTGYPFVVGVQADREKALPPGELAYKEEDSFFANIYANCDIELLRRFRYSPSNSFAVPVAAARINDWINQEKDVGESLQRLLPYPGSQDERYFWERSLRRDLPLVVISGMEDSHTYGICRKIMDELFRNCHIQAAALCSMEGEYDIRCRKLSSVNDVVKELLFMEYHYKTDMIFIAIKEHERETVLQRVDVDVEILLLGEFGRLLYEGGEKRSSVFSLSGQLYDILR